MRESALQKVSTSTRPTRPSSVPAYLFLEGRAFIVFLDLARNQPAYATRFVLVVPRLIGIDRVTQGRAPGIAPLSGQGHSPISVA